MKIKHGTVFALCLLLLFGLPVSIQAEDYPTVNVIINNSYMRSDVPAILKDGRTLVPLRAVSENLGAQVEWNGDINTVYIDSVEAGQEVGSEEELYQALVMYIAAQVRMADIMDAGATLTNKDKWDMLFTIYTLEKAEQILIGKNYSGDLGNIQLDTLQALAELKSCSWMIWRGYNGEYSKLETAKGYLQFLSLIYEERPAVVWYNANVKRLGTTYGTFNASGILGNEQDYRAWLTKNMYLIGTLPEV